MRGLPLVYHPAYSCPWPSSHRFPMGKFADLHRVLRNLGLATADTIHKPTESPPHEWFENVHDRSYYRAFLAGNLGEAQERRIGFREETRRSPLIARTRLECSGTVRTVQLALEHGLAANLAGGTHHAHHDFGSGFTILNDLAIAATWARGHTSVRRVAVVDLDVHQGDGTAAIFRNDDDTFTMSMHCGANFPFRKQASDLDVDVPRGTGDRGYLQMLREHLPAVLAWGPDLVLYDAGVDVYKGDQLGYLNVSHAGIYERDRYVIDSCVAAGVPIACVIGGGYDRDALALARRHALLHRAGSRVWKLRGLGTPGDRSEVNVRHACGMSTSTSL